MVYFGIFVIVFCIATLILIYRIACKENKFYKFPLTLVGLLYISIFGWLIVITQPKEKSCLEYLRGNLEVKYEKIYVDSMLVRTDTIIEFKKR